MALRRVADGMLGLGKLGRSQTGEIILTVALYDGGGGSMLCIGNHSEGNMLANSIRQALHIITTDKSKGQDLELFWLYSKVLDRGGEW